MALWQYLIQSGFKKLMKASTFDLHEHTTKWVTSSKMHATFFKFKRAKDVKKIMNVITFPVKQKLSIF